MSEEFSETKLKPGSTSKEKNNNESLIAAGKGIWPLIISVFVIAIYIVVSVVMLFISWRVGRI